MVMTPIKEDVLKSYSLEDWMQSSPESTEWVNGELLEKKEVTLKHSRIQGNLYFYWRSYKDSTTRWRSVYRSTLSHKSTRSSS